MFPWMQIQFAFLDYHSSEDLQIHIWKPESNVHKKSRLAPLPQNGIETKDKTKFIRSLFKTSEKHNETG